MTFDGHALYELVVGSLVTAGSCPVYRHATPAQVDAERPWMVVQLPVAPLTSTRAVSPVDEFAGWELVVRVVSCARTPNLAGEPTPAVYEAALWASREARGVLLARTEWQAWGVAWGEAAGGGHVAQDRDVVNVFDDYRFVVRGGC